jgi:hypothetical protein
MPVLMEMALKASWPLQSGTRQLHGLACALFEADGAEHLGQDKPFAVWPVSAAAPGSTHDWDWRTSWLPGQLPPATALAPGQLRLGHVNCIVTEARHRQVSHAQLAAGPPLGSAVVTFRSPTYFSQNGSDVVIPDPRLIVGSWWRRWNASLPEGDVLAIAEDAWQAVLRMVRMTAFDLRTERRDSGRGHERSGFTGSATLRAVKDAPTAVRAVFGTLLRFAEFCGTGAQTTHGFGATSVSVSGGTGNGRVTGSRVQ